MFSLAGVRHSCSTKGHGVLMLKGCFMPKNHYSSGILPQEKYYVLREGH